MANNLKRSHKKYIFISLFIVLAVFFFDLPKYFEERNRIAKEKEIVASKYEAEAKECLAEKARLAAEKARHELEAVQAAEKIRLQALRVKIVEDFYQAINDHDCEKAIQLRPDYSKKSCLNIESVKIKTAKVVKETPTISVIYLKMLYRSKGKKRRNSFSGHLQLIKRDKQWLIAGKYSSKISLEEYLEKYKIASK
jgi:hypothetical protein